MDEDRLVVQGGRLHVRYGLTAEGDPLYLFGAADGTPLGTVRDMLRAASTYVDRLEARGDLTT